MPVSYTHLMNILFFLSPKQDLMYVYDDFTLRQTLEKWENNQMCIRDRPRPYGQARHHLPRQDVNPEKPHPPQGFGRRGRQVHDLGDVYKRQG